MTKWSYWAVGAGILLLMIGLGFTFEHHTVRFQELRQAQARLLAAGFHCTSDAQNGVIGTGFLISREQLAWHEVGELGKAGAMGPAWKGKVWITRGNSAWQLHAIPDNADARVWGDVLAFGDPELLAELDDALAEGNIS